jgi:hypothetical protein
MYRLAVGIGGSPRAIVHGPYADLEGPPWEASLTPRAIAARADVITTVDTFAGPCYKYSAIRLGHGEVEGGAVHC